MDNKTIAIIAVVIVAIVAVAAFVVMNNNGNGGDPDEREKITVTDLAGRQVSLQVPLERVVCGDAESMTLIASIAGKSFNNMLVGYDSNLNTYYPDLKDMWADAGMDFAKMKEVGSFMQGTFNWETVAALEPDAVFIPMWVYEYGMVDEKTIDKMAKAGIPVVNLDLYLKKLDSSVMKKNCDILGKIFNNQKTADKLCSFYTAQIEKVSSKLSQVEKGKYVFYYETLQGLGNYSNSQAVSTASFLGQTTVMPSGGEISPEAFATGNISFVFLDAMRSYAECGKNIGWGATVTKADIDSIAAGLSKRAGWNEAPAVKNDKVYIFDMMVMGSTFDCWFIYQFIAEKMFPEIYGDMDILKTLEGYYAEYLPWIDFKGVWYFGLDGEIGSSS